MKPACVLSALLACGALPAAASSAAPLTAGDLYASCTAYGAESESAGATTCVSYIRGLIDAARMIAGRDGASRRNESFRERALRTRAGSRAASLRRYCLDPSISLAAIIDDLLANRVPDEQGTPAAEVVQRTLDRLHRCTAH